MNTNTWTTLIVSLLTVGAVQGAVFSVLLWRNRSGNRLANRLLAVLLMALTWRLLVQILRHFGVGFYDGFYYLALDVSWALGALLYFYVLACLRPNFRLRLAHWPHALPLLLQMGFSLFVRLQNLSWDGTRASLSWLGYWGYWLWMNQPTVYIVASALIVAYAHMAQKRLQQLNDNGDATDESWRWLNTLLAAFKYGFAAVLLLLIGDVLLHRLSTSDAYFFTRRTLYDPFFIGVSVLTYWLGLQGFKRKDQTMARRKNQLDPTRSAELQALAKALDACMRTEHLYTQPTLTMPQTARALGVKPHALSQCLNSVVGVKFNDYINAWRVEAVQALLRQEHNRRHNLLTLAFEAGFNSKASFNRAVKKHLGISPRQLKARLQGVD